MVAASGIGADIKGPEDAGWLFGEDQARYVIATDDADAVLAAARAAGVTASAIGTSGGSALTRNGTSAISVDDLQAARERWLPAYMASD